MATISLQEAEVVKTLFDGPAVVLNRPEAAGQSFARGAFVYLVNGQVTALAGTPNDSVILGMALHAASGVTGTNVQVALATADVIFAANVTTAQVTALADVGKSYGFAIVSGRYHINKTVVSPTLTRLLIVDVDSRDVLGDTQGRLHFIVLSKYRQFDVTS